MEEKVTAGCGMEIRRSERFICPYYSSRKEEWIKKNHDIPYQCPNVQLVTNICLDAPKEFLEFPFIKEESKNENTLNYNKNKENINED